MKDTDIKERCPVCKELVSKRYINIHISTKAVYEKRMGNQFKHEHLTYYNIHLKPKRFERRFL